MLLASSLVLIVYAVFCCRISAAIGPPHYCYYCSTSLSDVEPMVQRQIMTQRLFYYPREAIKSRCQEPWLSRAGGLQICSSEEPMCVSIQARMENNVNFTILGCVDSVLRPSMKLPEKGDDQCTTLELAGLDFSLCYCSTNLCNTGGGGGGTVTVSSPSTKRTIKPYSTKVVKHNPVNFTSKEVDLHSLTHMYSTRDAATTKGLLDTSKAIFSMTSSVSTVDYDNETEETSGEMITEQTIPLMPSSTIQTSSSLSRQTTVVPANSKTGEIAKVTASSSTDSLNYNPDEQEIVEMNSEEMERRAGSGHSHSNEYTNYDLSSTEVDYIPVATKPVKIYATTKTSTTTSTPTTPKTTKTTTTTTPKTTPKTTTTTTTTTTTKTTSTKTITTPKRFNFVNPVITVVETTTFEPIEIVSATVHTSVLLTILASSNFIKQSKTIANITSATQNPLFPRDVVNPVNPRYFFTSSSTAHKSTTTSVTPSLRRTTRSSPTASRTTSSSSSSYFSVSTSPTRSVLPTTNFSSSSFSYASYFPLSTSPTHSIQQEISYSMSPLTNVSKSPATVRTTFDSTTDDYSTSTTALVMDQGIMDSPLINDTKNRNTMFPSSVERRQTTSAVVEMKNDYVNVLEVWPANETLANRRVADSPRNRAAPVGAGVDPLTSSSIEKSAASLDTAKHAPVSGAWLSQRFPGSSIKIVIYVFYFVFYS